MILWCLHCQTHKHARTHIARDVQTPRQTRHKRCSMVCSFVCSLGRPLCQKFRITTKWTSETNNYFSPISRIRLFLLIPRTWPEPLWKFNISCYCRCFYVAAESEANICCDFSLLYTCTRSLSTSKLEAFVMLMADSSMRMRRKKEVDDKDYDSGLKSSVDEGRQLTKCTCSLFTFMMFRRTR